MYLKKTSDEILRQALAKLTKTTDITATAPGSVARALTEMLASDLGDFFSILDFNMKQSVLSTATGRSLDMWGSLYNVKRKTLANLIATSEIIGAFYFYVDTPAPQAITIPRGTRVYTDDTSSLGRQFVYATTEDVTIGAGRLRAYAPIVNLFSDTVFTAGKGTLTNHAFDGPNGIVVKCTNPKAIAAQRGSESDEDYRTRLIAETRRQAGGTAYSLRFSALAVPGVRDVIIREATMGLGSVEVVVNSEDYAQSAYVTDAVRVAVSQVRPPGVRIQVRQPDLVRLDVTAAITMKRLTTTSEELVKFRAKNAILRYINTLSIGENMVYNRLVSEILDSSEEVVDVSFTGLGVNGSEILRKNYSPKEDEHIVPGTVTVQIS